MNSVSWYVFPLRSLPNRYRHTRSTFGRSIHFTITEPSSRVLNEERNITIVFGSTVTSECTIINFEFGKVLLHRFSYSIHTQTHIKLGRWIPLTQFIIVIICSRCECKYVSRIVPYFLSPAVDMSMHRSRLSSNEVVQVIKNVMRALRTFSHSSKINS